MNGKLVGKCSNCGSDIYDDKHYVTATIGHNEIMLCHLCYSQHKPERSCRTCMQDCQMIGLDMSACTSYLGHG